MAVIKFCLDEKDKPSKDFVEHRMGWDGDKIYRQICNMQVRAKISCAYVISIPGFFLNILFVFWIKHFLFVKKAKKNFH